MVHNKRNAVRMARAALSAPLGGRAVSNHRIPASGKHAHIRPRLAAKPRCSLVAPSQAPPQPPSLAWPMGVSDSSHLGDNPSAAQQHAVVGNVHHNAYEVERNGHDDNRVAGGAGW